MIIHIDLRSPPFATKGIYDTPIYSSPDASLSRVMPERVQYGLADRTTTVLRNLMACTDTLGCSPVPSWYTLFLPREDSVLSVPPPLGVMLGLIVVAYRSKQADDRASEISRFMVLGHT